MPDPKIGRRLRIIQFSALVLQDILRAAPNEKNELFRGFTSDAPDDLVLMGFYRQCPWSDTYEFVVGSESFELVLEGTELPYWTPTFTSHYEERDADAA